GEVGGGDHRPAGNLRPGTEEVAVEAAHGTADRESVRGLAPSGRGGDGLRGEDAVHGDAAIADALRPRVESQAVALSLSTGPGEPGARGAEHECARPQRGHGRTLAPV